MNLVLFLAVATWHVAQLPAVTSETKLFCNADQTVNDIIREMSKSTIRFSLELHKAIAMAETGSFALSTLDVFIGLSQLFSGADGLSQQQLRNVLNYCPYCSMAEYGIPFLAATLHTLQCNDILTNGTIFHSSESGLKDDFVNKMNRLFGSDLQTYRSWNEIRSGRAMYELATTAGISRPLYQPFEEEKTLIVGSAAKFSFNVVYDSFPQFYQAEFYRNERTAFEWCIYAQFMTNSFYGEFKYRRDSNDGYATAQYMELSLKGPLNDKIRTFIILSRNITDSIFELEKNINEETLNEILSNTNTRIVKAVLPKRMKINSAYNLMKPLENMNLTEMFKTTDDFSKIVEARSVTVGPIFQQVEMIYECVYGDKSSQVIQPKVYKQKEIYANHPFVIMTVSKGTNPVILSMGRYA